MRRTAVGMRAVTNRADGRPARLPAPALLSGCVGRRRDVTPVISHPHPAHLPAATDCRRWCPPHHIPPSPSRKWPWRREAGAKGLQGCIIPFFCLFVCFSHIMWEDHPIGFWLGVAWPHSSHPGLGTSSWSQSWWHAGQVFGPGSLWWESRSQGVVVLVPSSTSFPREVRAPQYHHWSSPSLSHIPILRDHGTAEGCSGAGPTTGPTASLWCEPCTWK